MSTEIEISRIEAFIADSEVSKAKWVLRDALARSPQNPFLLKLATKLAGATESRAMDLAYNKASENSREALDIESITREAK